MHRAWTKKTKLIYKVTIFVTNLIVRVLYRHKVYGIEAPYKGGAIIAANHTSFLDPPLVSVSWPEEVDFLARQTLFTIPVLGSYIRKVNTHPVRSGAGDAALFKMVIRLLQEGKKVILFPEGTRSEEDRLGPIKPGIALLVEKANAAIIPAYIHGAQGIWGRARKFPKLWGRTACVFGAPILWSTFSHLEKKEAYLALTEALIHAIESLRAWYLAGAKGPFPH